MRTPLFCLSLLLGACGCEPEPAPEPNWSGPPLSTRWIDDGALEVMLTAPTASHELTLRDVTVDRDTADVQLDYVTPGEAYVAQVVTKVTAVVPAARLGSATRVQVWITTTARGSDTAPGQATLAVVASRP